jgi:hypothetical protein
MRYLRDAYLAKSEEGKRMIQKYYEIAPCIVERIKGEENANEIFSGIFNNIRWIASLIKIGDFESATTPYMEMILRLKKRYLTAQIVVDGEAGV